MFVIKKSNDFRPDPVHKFGLSSHQWLQRVSHWENAFIQYQLNLKEKRLTDRNLPVDGFIEARKKILQFYGCYYHGVDMSAG